MKRSKKIYLTIEFIKNLDNPGCYVELAGTDEAGMEIRDEDKIEEKIKTSIHEFIHFLMEYFWPNLPSKKRKKCLTIDNEQLLCETIGKIVKGILKPFIKEYYRDYGSQKK